jgi:hypothetical protein
MSVIKRIAGATVLFTLLFTFGGSIQSRATQHEIKPGVERWPIKTSVPTGADIAHGTPVSYADLVKLDAPPGIQKSDHRYQAVRIPSFPNQLGVKEGDILTTTGWLHLVAGENDGDFHIQISDSPDSQASCLIVEVPNPEPEFVASAELRPLFQKVREFIKVKLLRDKEPSPRGSVMQHPIYVTVTGQLFYDDAHVGDPPRGKKGCQAATLWELHPVTDIEFATR